jgi:IS30 family transposase
MQRRTDMSLPNINTKKRGFKHLTERERYQLEILVKEKKSPKEIAAALGRHRRTIEREIARGTVRMLNSDLTYKDSYCADAGQRKYEQAASNKGAGLKIGHDHKLAAHIEKRIIKDKYSPDAVIGEIRAKGLKFETEICTKTLYNYIDKGIFANITNKDLPVKRHKKKGSYKRVRVAQKNLRGTSIEERPAHIEKREEYGHWEMDCVVGKRGGSGAALLVLTERVTRQEIIRKMPDKTQESVKQVLDQLERRYGERFPGSFKTITVDNGTEFLDSKGLETSVIDPEKQRFKLYYAHPYSSWERGTNENANKLIRRFIPKGTDIGKLNHKDIQRIEDWMNNYPRRIHGYRTPKEMAA